MIKNLIDTHFHLDHYRNYMDIAVKITELKQYTICVTNSPGVFLSCKNLVSETQYLKFAIGFHPQDKNLSNRELQDFMRLINRTNYVGEIGLDFTNASSYMPKPQQLYCFEEIVRKCALQNKLMTIHVRGAEPEAISVLKKYAPKKMIIHWFTGDEECLRRLVEIGCYFSINSNMVVGKNKEKYLLVPKDRILIESDGPYTKIVGKNFDPSFLCQSYEMIGEFFNNSNLCADVFDNFNSLLSK